jgi:hypothetical protein
MNVGDGMARAVKWAAVATAVAIAGTAAPAMAATAPGSTATLTVSGAPQGRLASDFVGLSFEMRELGTGGFDARKGNLVNLFRTLSHGSSLRISGNTLDRDTLWLPTGTQPPNPKPDWIQDYVTPADIRRLDGFLRATGWKSMVGINVGRWDQQLGVDQARTMQRILGPRLQAVQCGNEPNSWPAKVPKPAGYDYPQYKPDWEQCANAVGNNRVAGPDTSSPGSTAAWVDSFARDERARINLVTIHNYSVGSGATPASLLSPATNAKQTSVVAKQLASAKAVNVPIRLDETNSAANGGIAGVSDTYASALWAMDYSLQMAHDGFQGVNLHTGLGVCDAPLYNGKFQLYTPICAANEADAAAAVYKARPEFYGLYLASRLGGGRFLPTTLTTDRNINAYAVRGDDGRTRIALIQKDDTATAPVHVDLTVGGHNGTAQVVRMTGGKLTDTDGVRIQGGSVDRRGQLRQHAPDRVRVKHGTLGVDLAAGSAVVITLPC